MKIIEVYTLQAVENILRENNKKDQWYILRFNGYSFKIWKKWAQIMQSPSGIIRDSGTESKTIKGLIIRVITFIENNK